MSSSVVEPLIFPIAHYIGEQYDSETQRSTFDLRGGWSVAHVDPSERLVWAAAHGDPSQLQQGRRWTRAALEESLKGAISNKFGKIIDSLIKRDILVEVQPGSAEAIQFARNIRLVPLRLGLGNCVADPTTWRIGSDIDTPLVGVSHTVYNTWEWSHLYRNLWDSCESLANLRSREGTTIPATEGERNPQVILYEVLESAHTLLSTASAYFDVPFDWGTV